MYRFIWAFCWTESIHTMNRFIFTIGNTCYFVYHDTRYTVFKNRLSTISYYLFSFYKAVISFCLVWVTIADEMQCQKYPFKPTGCNACMQQPAFFSLLLSPLPSPLSSLPARGTGDLTWSEVHSELPTQTWNSPRASHAQTTMDAMLELTAVRCWSAVCGHVESSHSVPEISSCLG